MSVKIANFSPFPARQKIMMNHLYTSNIPVTFVQIVVILLYILNKIREKGNNVVVIGRCGRSGRRWREQPPTY